MSYFILNPFLSICRFWGEKITLIPSFPSLLFTLHVQHRGRIIGLLGLFFVCHFLCRPLATTLSLPMPASGNFASCHVLCPIFAIIAASQRGVILPVANFFLFHFYFYCHHLHRLSATSVFPLIRTSGNFGSRHLLLPSFCHHLHWPSSMTSSHLTSRDKGDEKKTLPVRGREAESYRDRAEQSNDRQSRDMQRRVRQCSARQSKAMKGKAKKDRAGSGTAEQDREEQ